MQSKTFFKILLVYYALNYINEKLYSILGLTLDIYSQLNGRMFMALFIMCSLIIMNNE